ncbi:MAG: glycoside hydrolase family 38 N-terminal domain-containing protein, partial [Bacilli bacterium]
MKTLHLVSNAHLDPVWLWEWEEGAAAAISTFRVAADFCEQFDGYVFNHNEVVLYKWIEEYEPRLFTRIQRLIEQGKWHIMGGWYLQPDCNMPSGESFVRNILLGRQFFYEKFGVKPTTAINFDSFGHTRGLVQIMRKSGYDSYIFCRPDSSQLSLPANDFVWVGYDGSEIIGHHAVDFYNSTLGKADEKIRKWIEKNQDAELGLLLWGVGDHGGGPSRHDLNTLQTLMNHTTDRQIVHSIPERYFAELQANGRRLPRYEGDLNPVFPGCYTSQIRIKQKHRMLENEIYMVEKMATHASMQGYSNYPTQEIHQALCDLMMSEFHDILPGTSIQPVEETSLRLLDHGLEIVSRAKARMFFALSDGQEMAAEGDIPILVYNPHPYSVRGVVECEFQLQDQNWNDEFSNPVVFCNGVHIPSQPEKELSNLNLDWRKRVVFYADLEPGQMNRFDCRIEILAEKPRPMLHPQNGVIDFKTDDLHVVINCQTGLMDLYEVNGVNYIRSNAFLPLVIGDNDDTWGMLVSGYRDVVGQFALMLPEEGSKFSGIEGTVLDAVRVIEDGDV